jgi:D-alanyl-D-alanine endopeptidase (penicillin-binding protein 7)
LNRHCRNLPVLALIASTFILLVAIVRPAVAGTLAGSDLGALRPHALKAHAHRLANAEPALLSTSALVWDQTASTALLARNADTANPIASITKLMTAMVVMEAEQSGDERLEITSEDEHLPKPATSRLTVGTTLSRNDLLRLALMASENRAANALARNYPGGLSACVDAMNAKALQLGMSNTHFVEPTGLSSSNVASPQDLSRLVIAASQNPTIQAYSTASHYAVPIHGKLTEFHTTDRLVASAHWDILVQKTGYISEAGRCLVMEALIAGRAIVIVLLDSKGLETRIADAQRIRTWMERQAR